jgi:hypothetical protein
MLELLKKPHRVLFSPIRFVYRRLCQLPVVHRRAILAAYGPGYQSWYKSNPCEKLPDREALYQSLIQGEGLDGPIDYIEFGVYRGDTIRWWVANNRHPESRFVGFDSFEGLPEAWEKNPKGTFSVFGEVPEVADPRCGFVKELFHETMPGWLIGRDFPMRTVLHLDADLYSSTLLVLTQILPRLKKDDIIIFDEFCSYLHEYRALVDATTAYPMRFKALAHTVTPLDAPSLGSPAWKQVALKVI